MSKWISTAVTLPATHRSRRARVWYRPEDSFLLPLQVRRTTLFEIDRSNHLFSERDAKLLVHPGAPVAKALLASLGPKSSTLQSVRCAAYPHEIVHDGGTRREYRRGLELWPPVREAGTARSPVPHLARLTPEVVAALRNRTRVVRRISLEASNVGTKKWPPQRRRPLRFSVVRLLTPLRASLGLQYLGTVRWASTSRYRSSEYRRQKAYLLHRSLY